MRGCSTNASSAAFRSVRMAPGAARRFSLHQAAAASICRSALGLTRTSRAKFSRISAASRGARLRRFLRRGRLLRELPRARSEGRVEDVPFPPNPSQYRNDGPLWKGSTVQDHLAPNNCACDDLHGVMVLLCGRLEGTGPYEAERRGEPRAAASRLNKHAGSRRGRSTAVLDGNGCLLMENKFPFVVMQEATDAKSHIEDILRAIDMLGRNPLIGSPSLRFANYAD